MRMRTREKKELYLNETRKKISVFKNKIRNLYAIDKQIKENELNPPLMLKKT